MDSHAALDAGNETFVELAPLGGDPHAIESVDGALAWSALSFDPMMLATPRGGGVIARGWHRITVEIDCLSGDVRDPEIFLPDPSGNLCRLVRLEREGAVYRAEFFLAQDTAAIRFDPSHAPCEFACDGLRIARLGKQRAAPRPLPAALSSRLARMHALAGRIRARLTRVRNVATGPSPASISSQRKQRVLASIRRDGAGIEIGPSHDPIAPKRDGFDVHIIDHATREGLLHKYAQHNIALDRIEEVDFVWKGESYLELTGRPRHYDWIIASHLVEHTPDLIDFLANCDAVLKDDGVLALVIPDKRRTFDRFRPITGLARIIDAHIAGNRIHSAGASAEYFMNVAARNHNLSWNANAQGDYHFIHSASYARDMIREVTDKGSYLDIHNWCFTPNSFRLLVGDLYALGYTKLREVSFEATDTSEFYVTLGRHGKGPRVSRLELLRAIDAELAASN